MSRHSPRGNRWARLRAALLEECDYLCQRCKVATAVEIHHLLPVAKGGPQYDRRNLLPVCSACHQELHGRMVSEDQRAWDDYVREVFGDVRPGSARTG